jgi:tetratricopeptide (TPR) repeat protein
MSDVAGAVTKAAAHGAGPVPRTGQSYGDLMRRAEEAMGEGDFATARSLLEQIRSTPGAADEPYVVRQLALATYKSKQPHPQAALQKARELLKTLGPATSNDPETLGLWGAVHQRLWELTHEGAHLDEAVRSYKRGFYLRNDYYNGICFAYLLNVRAADTTRDRAEAIADFVQARAVRRAVAEICEQALRDNRLSVESRYWLLSTLAEALLGGGRAEEARKVYEEAFSLAPHGWMSDSTMEQRKKLQGLLSDSPLRYLRGGES